MGPPQDTRRGRRRAATFRAHALRQQRHRNPLNEVRILCGSPSNNDGVVTAEKAIKVRPAQTVPQIEFGDAFAISRDDFARLSEAFFTEGRVPAWPSKHRVTAS